MHNEFINMLLIALGFAVTLMFFVWALAVRINNFGIVDISWSIGFLPIAIFFAAMTHGDPTRRLLIAGMAALWSLRLGVHVAVRVISHHPKEDVRYSKFREKWGAHAKRETFLFFELQALILAALSIVFLLPCQNAELGISPVEWIGVAIWALAVAGESRADHQLKVFRADPKNKGAICRVGLWNYSRHPNYFFEWLVWVGFFVFACGSPYGFYTILCPALMLYFLLQVTGIPLTEQLSVQSKGDAYREYQRTTSAFVPWFKKTAPALTPPLS